MLPNPKVERGLKTTTKTSANISAAIAASKAKIRQQGWPSNYHVISNGQELGAVARDISRHKEFAFDTETGGLNPWKDPVYCVSLYVGGQSYLCNFDHPMLPRVSRAEFCSVLGTYFTDARVKRIGFNLSFDYHMVEEQLGIKCGPMHFDSSVGIWLLNPDAPTKKLKPLCEELLGIDGDTYESVFGKTAWIVIDPEVASYYALKDAELHWKLYEWEEKQFKKYPALGKLMSDLEMPCTEEFYETEAEGIPVDMDYLQNKLGPELDFQIAETELKLAALNMPLYVELQTPATISQWLFTDLKLPNYKDGSTAKEVLEEIQDEHPCIELILEHRGLTKLKGSFVDSLPTLVTDGKLHPSIRTIGSETGRVSMSKPNLLQMPAKAGPLVRRSFMAGDDYILVSKDLSGQELRIQCAFSRDKRLTEIILGGGDLYAESANVFFGTPIEQLKKGNVQRDLGKKCVLAQNYGAQAKKIASIFKCTNEKAQKYLDDWDRRFVGYTRWRDLTIAAAQRKGYVETILGRRRWLDYKRPGITRFEKFKLDRQAGNTPIQGSAADQIKLAYLLCQRYFKENNMKSRALFTIHDEVLFRIHKSEWTPQLNSDLDYIMVNAIVFEGIPMETATEVYKERWGEKCPESEWFDMAVAA